MTNYYNEISKAQLWYDWKKGRLAYVKSKYKLRIWKWTITVSVYSHRKQNIMKQWYQSRTIWSSILRGVAGILTSLALVLNGELLFIDFLPGLITTLWGIVDVIIRTKTTQPLAGFSLKK